MINMVADRVHKVVLLSLFVITASIYAEEMKIMPFGDSITYGDSFADNENPRPTGLREAYRSHLYYKLRDSDYEADFVGSVRAGESVSPAFDPDNEGHPGWSSYRLADHVNEFLEKNHANVILVHAGTNDHSDNVHGVENILNWIDYYEVQSHKRVTVVLALIINRKEYDKSISGLNSNIRKLASKRIAAGDDIVLVDMEHGAGLNSNDYADTTHPNSYGYEKMANVWFKALMELGDKPLEDNEVLREYPYTLIDKDHIDHIYVNNENSSVTFLADIPNSGIRF
ncbi:hypothetical protein MNB_SV-6-671 [hydrothermal vent metagenome]|uniref:SGNH hydrolase-type esterase domain-containing protein n=1 Tax=hydrothermal vent metagenome TaxID=652676 RepID=A0A1W1BQH6_9ZZZZ